MKRTTLEPLRTATADQAGAWFADIEPEALVAVVRETSDDDLLELIDFGAITGVLRGQLKVKGDRVKALQLSSVMRIPQPR